MRCSICDFSKDTPSEFYEGLHIDKSRYTRVRRDKKTGNYVCDPCANDIEETHRDTVMRSQDEFEFGEGVPRIFSTTEEDRAVFSE